MERGMSKLNLQKSLSSFTDESYEDQNLAKETFWIEMLLKLVFDLISMHAPILYKMQISWR